MTKRTKTIAQFETVHNGLFGKTVVINGENIDGDLLDDSCRILQDVAGDYYYMQDNRIEREMLPLEIVADNMGTVPPPSKKQRQYPYPTNEDYMKIGNRNHDLDWLGTLALCVGVITPFACVIWFAIRLLG